MHDAVETTELRDLGTVQELAWNLVGTAEVPIEQVEASLVHPGAVVGASLHRELPLDHTSARSPAPAPMPTRCVAAPSWRRAICRLCTSTYRDGTARAGHRGAEERWSLAQAFRATLRHAR
ncbi:MAG: hypothetical protein R2749_12790 [Acidimicrobiales bacterium]